MEDDLLNLTRSVYLQGKTELTDEELAVVLSLPPESQKDFTFNEIYTNKEFKEVRKNPSELNNLKDKLKELPEYLKYKNTYISKSKLYFELSSILYNEIPCLTILNEIKKPAYLLPFSFAQDLNGNKIFADSITQDYFTDFKSIFVDKIIGAFKGGSEQGENIFFLVCNEKLTKDEIKKQLVNRVNWRDRNIDKTAEYIFYDENKAVCYTFLSDEKGTVKELDDIDLKKIRLAISDKPLSLVVSITSPTSNTDILQNNNDYVKFYFNSNLIKGSLYQYKTQGNITNRILKYYRELYKLEQITKTLPEGTLKQLNEDFIKKEKETSYYKSQEIDNRYFRTLYFGTQEELALLVENRALRMGFTDAIPEQTQTYITRDKPEPKKTIRAYKCFFVDELGRPSALFVGGADALPQNIWLQAKDVFHFKSPDNDNEYVPTIKNPNSDGGKTGDEHTFPEEAREYLVEHGFIGRNYTGNKVTCVAYRPGWHAGTEPISPQLGILNPEYSEETKSTEYKCIHRYNQVIFEVELDASTDYTDFARSQDKAKTKKGKINPKKADLQYIPEDGFYRYATNQYLYQHPELGEWMISSSMKIIRALTQEECDQICKEHGIPVQKWENGLMDLQTLGYDGPEYEAVRKTLAPITYDENGEIIPLSKRFDKTNPDVLHELHYTPQKITEVKIPGIQKSAFEFDENYGEKEQEAERLERLNSLKAIVEAPDFACIKIKTHDDHYILIHKSSRYNDPKESPDTKYQMSWFDKKGAIMHHSAANTEDILSELHSNIGWDEFTAEVMTFDYEKERQLVNAQVLEEPNTNYFTAPENNRNRENHQVYETNGLRVDVDTEGKITEQGWKDLSAIMDMYSNKSYETTRYLFVKDGKIIRQTAISCKIPNTTIVDEANSQKLNSYRHYAEDNDCQIIMVHNHPSGDIRPSDADIRENNILLEELKDSSGHNRLMGCVILDHGNMSIFNSENKNWYTCLKGELHEGFDVFESELYSSEFRNTNRPIVREKENAIAKRLSSLASELDAGNTWNTKDFIPIFFLNERNEIKKHEYINVSEFKDEAELKRKLKSLGTEYSSTKLYMLPTNYDNNILCHNFNQRTRMVTDIYCSEPGYKNHTLNENKNRIFTNEDLVISESDDSLNYPYFEKEVSNNTNNIEEQKYMTELGKFNTTVVELKDLSKEDAEKRLEYFNVINFKDSTGFNSEYNNITSKYFNFYEHEDERLIFLKAAEDLGHHTNDVYGNQRIVEQYLRYKFNLPLIYENGEIIHRTQEELDQYKEIFDFINFAAYDITVDNLDNLKAREIANPQQLFEKINEILRTKEFSINHEKDDISLNTQEQILNESETLDYKNTNTEIGAKYSEIKNKYPAMSNEDILSAAISESMGIKVNYGDSITTDPYENNPMATFIINHFVKYLENNDIGPDGVPMKNNGETINIHNIDELKKFIDSKPVTYERSEWMGGEVKKERILSEEIQNDIERINSIFKGITLSDGKGESKNLNELFYSQYNDETHDNYNEPKNILKNNIASLILENADFGLLSKFGKITINPEVKEQDKELYESLTHVQNIFNEARQKFSNQLADMIVAEKLTVNSFNDIQTNINEYLNKNETYLQYMKDEPELTEKFMKYQLSDSLSTKEIENKNIDTNNSSDESLLKSISINSSIMPEQNQKNNNLDPISFLQEALKLKSKEDYKQFYDTYFNFNHGRINDIPPIADNKVGLFIGDDKEPIETLKGTNSNRKQLVEKAIEEGIALFCPSPEEVMEEGQEAIKKCLKQYEFYLNRPLVHDVEQTQNNEQKQKETTPLTEALPNWWKNIPEEKIRDLYNMENIGTLVDFVKEPFTIGTRLPPLSTAKKTIDGITTLIQENDWTLDKVNNNDSSVTITRMNNGIREFKKLDSTYYNHMIIETKNYLNSLNNNLTLKQHLDRTYQYEDTLGINQNETRENSAAQFWHNFEVRCKSVGENDLKNPAGNLYDAMDIAKELYSKLTSTEKKKLKKIEKSYEKETGKSYQEHLEQRYKEIFKGREIKDFDVYDKSSLTRTSGISHTQNALDDSHKLPDDLNLKIGDIVRIGVMAHDVKGRKRNLPPTDMEIKNVSKETNTIVLYDSIKKARFDIPLDTFISHQREVNLKLAKTQKKEQKKEIKKDLKIYGMDR